jgi:hypothetical protein
MTPQITWRAEKNGGEVSDIPFGSSRLSRLIRRQSCDFSFVTRSARRLPIIVAIRPKELISQPELPE